MTTTAEQVLKEFFSKLGPPYKVARASFEEYLADDCVWENSGFPTCNGKQACLEFLDHFAGATGTDSFEFEIRSWAAAGNAVVTERIDHFRTADGTTWASLALGGVLEVGDDGKIVAWRDYFDPRPLLPPG
ncbi:MAG: limonene-1,2-epoxide hydrolase family protein [Actinomycetota bacterium]